jgi:tetratricopeptide (TPR) repeat protein
VGPAKATPPEPSKADDPLGEEEGGVEPAMIDPADQAKIAAEVQRARRLHERGKSKQAHAVLDAVLEAAPSDAPALVLRSSIYIEERNLDEALSAAQASVEADPAFPDGHLAVGVIEHERGEMENAADAYRKYLDLAPDGIYARSIKRQLGRLESKLGKGG